MSDLISRSGLIIRLRNASVIPFSKMLLNEKHKLILEFEDMIKTQPTAYDLEKVIQKLEKEKTNFIGMGTLQSAYFDKGIDKAIEIVKSGGIAVEQKGERE